MIVTVLSVGVTGLAYAQETPSIPEDIPIVFSEAQILIIGVGILGGLTSAYLGSRKAKATAADGTPYQFNIHKFGDRVIMACITSIGLAITAAAGFLELNAITLFLIYVGSLGTAQLTMEVRNRNG